jgi:hypothetical protein
MFSAGELPTCAFTLGGASSNISQKTVRHKICIMAFAGVDVLTLDLNITEFMQ